MEEAIRLIRAYWQEENVNFQGRYYQVEEMAMEPKPPQGGGIPIWIGGTRPAALKRVAEIGDGWIGMIAPGDPPLEDKITTIRGYAEAAGRDPGTIGMQMSLSPDALDKAQRKQFYADPQLLLRRLVELRELGFDSVSIDCVPIFQQGYRSSDAMIDHLSEIYRTLKSELDR